MVVFCLVSGIILLLLLLWFYLFAPACRRGKSPGQTPFAHRGLFSAQDGIPENSLPAFHRASQASCGVELDVQITKDGKTVVFHDDTLRRMCGVDGRVSDFTYKELCAFHLGETGEVIPLFSDVLSALGTVPLLCEIKSPRGPRDIEVCIDTARQLDRYGGTVYVESFNPYALRWFRRHAPSYPRGILAAHFRGGKSIGAMLRNFACRNLLLNFIARPDFVSYEHKATGYPAFRLCCGLLRAPSSLWTIRTQEDYDRALALGSAPIFEGFLPHDTDGENGKDKT